MHSLRRQCHGPMQRQDRFPPPLAARIFSSSGPAQLYPGLARQMDSSRIRQEMNPSPPLAPHKDEAFMAVDCFAAGVLASSRNGAHGGLSPRTATKPSGPFTPGISGRLQINTLQSRLRSSRTSVALAACTLEFVAAFASRQI